MNHVLCVMALTVTVAFTSTAFGSDDANARKHDKAHSKKAEMSLYPCEAQMSMTK